MNLVSAGSTGTTSSFTRPASVNGRGKDDEAIRGIGTRRVATTRRPAQWKLFLLPDYLNQCCSGLVFAAPSRLRLDNLTTAANLCSPSSSPSFFTTARAPSQHKLLIPFSPHRRSETSRCE